MILVELRAKIKAHNSKLTLFVLVFMVIFIGGLPSILADIYVPALPSITHQLHSTASIIKLSITTFMLGCVISSLVGGPMADSIGTRKPLIIGMGIAVIGSFFIAHADSSNTFLLGRFIQGMGIGVLGGITRGLVQTAFKGKTRLAVMGYAALGIGLAPSIAPSLGGAYLQNHDWHALFNMLAFSCGIVAIITWLALPETKTEAQRQQCAGLTVMQKYWRLLCCRHYLISVLISACAFAGIYDFYTISPYLLQNSFHLSHMQYLTYTLAATACMVIGRFCNVVLLRYVPSSTLVRLCTKVFLVSGVLAVTTAFISSSSAALLVAPYCLFFIASSILFSNCSVVAFFNNKDIAGTAGCFFNVIRMIATLIVSFIVSVAPQNHGHAMGLIFLTLAAVSTMAMSMLPKDKQYSLIK